MTLKAARSNRAGGAFSHKKGVRMSDVSVKSEAPVHFCCCGNPSCKIQVKSYDKGLLFTDKTGQEHYMYLDPNAIVDLMSDLRQTLANLVREATHGEIS